MGVHNLRLYSWLNTPTKNKQSRRRAYTKYYAHIVPLLLVTFTCCPAFASSFNLNTNPIEVMCENVTNGGEVSGDEYGCPNPVWDPSPILNVTLPTGGTGDLEFIWMVTTDDPASPTAFWSPIPGSTSADYDPGPITQTTYYRRCARRAGCTDYIGETDIVKKEILCCENVTDGGTIAEDQSYCESPFDPDPLVSTALPTGGSQQPIEYQWAVSTTGTPYDPASTDWSIIPGANNSDFDPGMMPQTAYFVRLSKRFGCDDFEGVSNIVEIYIGDSIEVDLVATPVSCVGDNDGTAEVIGVFGGVPDYTYIWPNVPGAFADTLVGLLPGNYEVVVTDSKGCTGSAAIDVLAANPLKLVIAHENTVCHDSNDGSVTVTLNGGVAPYSYLWDDPLGQTTATANNLPAGAYSVTVTDGNGCTAVISDTITSPAQAIIQVTGTDATCFGANDGTATVDVSNYDINDFSVLWSNGQTSTTAVGLIPGDYDVTISDVNGCTEEASVSIAEPPLLEVTMVSDSASCFDSSDGMAQAVVTGGTPFPNSVYQYEWDIPNAPNVSMLDDVSAGIYNVTVTDANDCSVTGSVEIGAPTQIQISASFTGVSCNGFEDGSAYVEASGGTAPYSYLWNDGNGSTSGYVDSLPAGAYTVSVTDANNCIETRVINIEEPAPLAATFDNTNVTCTDDTDGVALVNPAGGTAPYTYLWSNGLTGQAIFNIGTGTYSVTITDDKGCELIEQTEIISTTTLSSTATAFDASCFNKNDGVAIANGMDGTAPYQYYWSNADTTSQIDSLFAGTYQVTITDDDGCTVTDMVTVGSPPILDANVQVVTEVLTYGGDEGSAEVFPTGGTPPYSYVWDNGMTGQLATGLEGGTHGVTITDANDCFITSNVTLVEPSKIGDYVWDDANQNGIQDAGESGLEGITVTLTGEDSNGNPVNLTTETDTSGFYAFDGLVGGDYMLEFERPANHLLTYQNATNDFMDSDPDSTGKVAVFSVAQGQYEDRWDAGFIILDEKINIGDKVWYDTNRDGLQGNLEAGVQGVIVRLWDSNNNIIGVEETDLYGNYLFEDVYLGDYRIEFSVASFPAGGYMLTTKDAGTDDTIDSDPDSLSGYTDVFTVFPFTLDDRSIDAGIYKECDNITDGGLIGHDEDLCGIGADPDEIVSLQDPTGGWGTIEYIWMKSTVPIFNGPGDPNWSEIPGSTSVTYDPGPINTSTYYIRCARREGCTDYIGETNVVGKKITPYPLAQIIDSPGTVCRQEPARFEAAIAGASATYEWVFTGGATPATASTRVVDPVSWNVAGGKQAELTVTRFGCSRTVDASVVVESCVFQPLIAFNDLFASQDGERIKIKWNITGNTDQTIFIVQTSNDGENFTTIGSVKGQAGLDISQYVFYDDQPRFGENHYRIVYEKMTHELQSGMSEKRKAMYKRFDAEFVQVFPNPTAGATTIELLEVQDEPVLCEIVNALGEKVMEVEIPSGEKMLEVDLNNRRNGLYFVKVQQAGRRAQICKLFKSE